MKSFAIVLVFAALFAQVFCVDFNMEKRSRTTRSIIETGKQKALGALETLTYAVDTAVAKASALIKDAYDKLNSTVVQYHGKAKNIINKAMKPLKEKLNEYLTKAKELGQNISKCRQFVDQFRDLPRTIVNQMISCQTSKFDDARYYTNDTLEQIYEVKRNIAEFGVKIPECKGNMFSVGKCLANLLGEITVMTAKAPVKIAWDVGNLVYLLLTFIPYLAACYTISGATVAGEGLMLLGKFAQCAALPQD